MCLTEAAVVIEARRDELRVLVGGHERLVTNLLVPDAAVGERVLIGLGMVLARAPDDDYGSAAARHDGAGRRSNGGT